MSVYRQIFNHRIPATLSRAFIRFNRDDGWAIASHLALSAILALFPFLLFAASIAGFFKLDNFAQMMVEMLFETWPGEASAALAHEIRAVLTVERSDILTLGGLGTLFFASNGIEALRTGLNRAYRQEERRAFWQRRLQSILFVVLSSFMLVAIAFLLVLLPLALEVLKKWNIVLFSSHDLLLALRFVIVVPLMLAGLLAAHFFLAAGKRDFKSVVPGIGTTLLLWIAGSLGFGYYLQNFANYVSLYAGLASVMIALIYLYMLGAIFIFGAEINSALKIVDEKAGMN